MFRTCLTAGRYKENKKILPARHRSRSGEAGGLILFILSKNIPPQAAKFTGRRSMAKCWLCSTKKGKRYCSPLDKLICPICCATNRLKKIDCNEDCRYLSGVALQIERAEEKEFSELMNRVPHGEHDDIFKEPAVAFMAYEIETLIRDAFVRGDIRITDKSVREAYKNAYTIHFKAKPIEESQLDELTKKLLELYSRNMDMWKSNMDEEMIGQVFLRLMISVKNMSGGRMGEFGYLNYLKNNLERRDENEGVVVEDKFGKKTTIEDL